MKIPSLNKKLKTLRKELKIIKKSAVTKQSLGLLRKAVRRDIEAVHQDLDGKFRRLAVEIVKNSQDIRELKVFAPALAEETRDSKKSTAESAAR